MHKALFLDRDGLINIDHAYVYRQEDFDFVDGIFEVCRAAQAKDYELIVVTNQSGIGRGYYTEADFYVISDWMIDQFKQNGVLIKDVYFCPYHPTAAEGDYKKDMPCRKPHPGMLLDAANEHQIDLAQSIMFGDSVKDVEAGDAAGVKLSVLYDPNDKHQSIANRVSKLVDIIPML